MDVQLRDLAKTYRDTQPALHALAATTLAIHSGEFLCIIGPSGCGKSTLLKLIADQTPPSTGSIVLNNESPHTMRTRKQIAWMSQNPALLPWKTVIENVRLPQRINARHRNPSPSPQALLELVGLSEFAQAYPATLSGGMQQRVALARALATGASLWLMDEPFAALDEFTRAKLAEEVLALWQIWRPTILWVTHSIVEAVRLADRVAVMSPRPGALRALVEIPYPRPRDETDPALIPLIRQLKRLLRP